jgi:hypothetical protein
VVRKAKSLFTGLLPLTLTASLAFVGCGDGKAPSPNTPATATTTTALAGFAPVETASAISTVSTVVQNVVDPETGLLMPPPSSPNLGSDLNPTVAATLPPPSTQSPYTRGLDTPEAAAKNLWDAWRDSDRERALLAAEPDAVTSLFSIGWGPEIAEQGCAALTENVEYRCAYVEGEAAWLLQVVAESGRYRVKRVSRIGPLPESAGATPDIRPGPTGGPTTAPKVRPRPTKVDSSEASGTPGAKVKKKDKNATTTKVGQKKKTTTSTVVKKKKRTPTTAPSEEPVAPAVPERIPVRSTAAP